MELTIPTDAPVLVTGATGYVAGPLVARLLEAGVQVHATVRDPSRTERLAYLRALAEAHPGELTFFAADLTQEGSFHEAMQGCRVVFHVASPFVMSVEDPQRDLVDPAVNGTRYVLDAVNDTPSVERVVLTSSAAAIYGDAIDLESTPRGVFDEEVWNTSSSLTRNPYSYSKLLAERKAWEMADAQDRWRLVVCNPAMVLGPGLKIHTGSESFQLMKRLVDGSLGSTPALPLGVVDVRDVAEAHLRAAFLPDAHGRHLLVGTNTSLPEMGKALEARWSSLKLPKRVVPRWLIWLVAPMFGLTRGFVHRNMGRRWQADTTRSREALGLTYRPLEETLGDFAAQLVEEGVVTPQGRS